MSPDLSLGEVQVLQHLQMRSGGGRGSEMGIMARGGIMEPPRGECFEKVRSQPNVLEMLSKMKTKHDHWRGTWRSLVTLKSAVWGRVEGRFEVGWYPNCWGNLDSS